MIARLEDVSHNYGSTTALTGVTWSVAEGITGVIGVNGAGKSTLLRILATELTPSEGDVEVFGERMSSSPEVRRQIGVMPQSADLPGEVKVRGFLEYMAWLREIRRAERGEAIEDALEIAQLHDRQNSRIGALSGGMRRRLLFAQAILAKPKLLILDEPTAGLDPEQRVRLRETIAHIAWPSAVVISSHLMEDLTPIAHQILMLDAGTVVFDGSVEELRALGEDASRSSNPNSAYETAFLSLRQRGVE